MKEFKKAYESEYFRVEELAAGVYAAYSSEEGGGISNAGIIDLGDKVIVFDAFLSTDCAKELKKAAATLTGKEVSYVVNSHNHFDHVLGNCVFEAEIPIISTYKTYHELKLHEAEASGMKEAAPEVIASLKLELKDETDEISRKMLERDIRFQESILKDDFGLRLPDMTFETSMEIHGASKTAVIREFSGGHTAGDAVLLLTEERIAFMGDILFTGAHPWLGAGDPMLWIDRIHEFQNYDFDVLVPGHGPAGTKEDLLLIEKYINALDSMAERIIKGELKLEEVHESMLPEDFKNWKGIRFLPNLKFYVGYKARLPKQFTG
ncbi:MAG: MBL fold metallo-hydrolase [Caulobacteraceae bacterium]